MRLHYLAVVAAVLLASVFNDAAASTDSKIVSSGQKKDSFSNRALRNGATTVNGEERTFNLEMLAGWANALTRSNVDEQLQKMLAQKTSAEQAFKLFKLDENIDKVLTSGNVNSWAKYIGMLKKQNPEAEASMVRTIVATYGDDAEAKMLVNAKNEPATEKIATELQAAQFKQWMKKPMSPDEVDDLLKTNPTALDKNLNEQIVQGYVKAIFGDLKDLNLQGMTLKDLMSMNVRAK
ncbi:hypothetical protein PHYSODRAFT_288797 [Phytophthora sojae]|uniref:RxLR effector protein n=2 Tax=Phytophthora sojae TaxID=67593 RepID=G5A859_PHYSP|nr:hypothetical protein PHYSODRAFT_288797 [Phytophthora sojae]AEK80796.1 Avh162 [Phytophthora sojae]AEK80798.1 Avh162 [Phytophthora sojae]EGZ08085.1 hypothetical protein PHYSODRAFT_288797 [Phytophthora sojae]|eukprot:XP_009536257.1 hypothetical protein PHYSODRAFT_288797 [Phytophthora sojae]